MGAPLPSSHYLYINLILSTYSKQTLDTKSFEDTIYPIPIELGICARAILADENGKGCQPQRLTHAAAWFTVHMKLSSEAATTK